MAHIIGAQTACCGYTGEGERNCAEKLREGFLGKKKSDLGHLSVDVSFTNTMAFVFFFLFVLFFF